MVKLLFLIWCPLFSFCEMNPMVREKWQIWKPTGGMEETSIHGEIKRLELFHWERKWVRVPDSQRGGSQTNKPGNKHSPCSITFCSNILEWQESSCPFKAHRLSKLSGNKLYLNLINRNIPGASFKSWNKPDFRQCLQAWLTLPSRYKNHQTATCGSSWISSSLVSIRFPKERRFAWLCSDLL